jgi:hypothetical protein
LALIAAFAVFGVSNPAHAQPPTIVVGPPSFQTLAGPSLEDEILYRLRFLGPRVPGDEIQLARLAELGAIATLVNIQNDLYGSVTGAQLQGDAFALWNATDAFDQAVRFLPPDIQNLAFSNLLLNNVEAAFGRMHSSLGGLPTLSPRGAFYLEGISDVLPFAESGLQMMEAEIVPPAPLPAMPAVSLDELRQLTRLLAGDLAELIRQANGWQGNDRERQTAVNELNRTFALVSGFDRMLALEPGLADVMESFGLLMQRAGPAEAALIGARRPEAWRPLRDRLSAISDALQLPRAISSLAPSRPLSPQATAMLPLLDRASTQVTAAVGAPEAQDGTNLFSQKSADQARRLQIKLIEFRQRVVNGESAGELGGRLLEIEALSQQLGTRAQPGPAVFRAGRRESAYNFDQVNQAIGRLRGLLDADGKR